MFTLFFKWCDDSETRYCSINIVAISQTPLTHSFLDWFPIKRELVICVSYRERRKMPSIIEERLGSAVQTAKRMNWGLSQSSYSYMYMDGKWVVCNINRVIMLYSSNSRFSLSHVVWDVCSMPNPNITFELKMINPFIMREKKERKRVN